MLKGFLFIRLDNNNKHKGSDVRHCNKVLIFISKKGLIHKSEKGPSHIHNDQKGPIFIIVRAMFIMIKKDPIFIMAERVRYS